MSANRMFGVELHGKLAPTSTVEFEDPNELYKWFQGEPVGDSTLHVRILCVHLTNATRVESNQRYFEVPLPSEVVEHACWKPEVYHNLTSIPGGGAAALLDNPYRFILQTPRDGGPFCSIAMSRHTCYVKGIYIYDNDAFSPLRMSGGDLSLAAWRSTGLQITTLPQMLLETHSIHLSQLLADIVDQVKDVEKALDTVDGAPLDFGSLSRILHACSAKLVDVERRSRFEQNIIKAIETVVAEACKGNSSWPPLVPQHSAISSRAFDFESLPRRVVNARATISNLIQQRNEQLNLELTQASSRIAEATLSDSRSMRTIAIMTMVLLPPTAVATLFSMNMFDWTDGNGDGHIASKYLWIYFVVTVPLTGMILITWWFWNRRSQQEIALRGRVGQSNTGAAFRDEEAGLSGTEGESMQENGNLAKAKTEE